MRYLSKKISIIFEFVDEKRESMYLATLTVSLLTMLLSNTVLIEESVYSFANDLYLFLKIIRYLTYLVFIALIVVNICKKNCNRCIMCITFAIAFLSMIFSHDFQIFSYFLFVLAAVNVDSKKILRTYLVLQSAFLIIMVILSSLNVIENFIFDFGLRNRNCLGFSWTTTPPMLLFFITINYLYLKDIRLEEIILLTFVNVLMFQLTNTRFAFLLGMVILLLFTIIYFKKSKITCFFQLKIVRFLVLLSPVICGFVSIVFQIFYNSNNKLLYFLNSILSNRLELGCNAFKNYDITLFGQNIHWVGFSVGADTTELYNYVDSSYMQILLSYGLIVILLVIIAYVYIQKGAIKNNDIKLMIIIISILILSITEPRLINIIYNPFIILTSQIMQKKEEKTCSNMII